MWPLECKQEFPKIWPGDLVFYPKWPIFELGLDIVKTNILTMFHKNRITNVVNIKCWRTTHDGRHTTTDDGQPLTTIAHHEHFVETGNQRCYFLTNQYPLHWHLVKHASLLRKLHCLIALLFLISALDRKVWLSVGRYEKRRQRCSVSVYTS